MTRFPWGQASICWRGAETFPVKAGGPEGCIAGREHLQEWGARLPVSLQSAYAAPCHFLCCPPPRRPQLTVLVLWSACPSPLSVPGHHLWASLSRPPYCPVSPPPITRANSGCVWRARVSLGHLSQPVSLLVSLWLTRSLCPCLFLPVSFEYLFLCIFLHLSMSLSLLPCLMHLTFLSPLLYLSSSQRSCPPPPPTVPSLRPLASVLSSICHGVPSLHPTYLEASLTPTPFLSPVLSPPISSSYLPSPASTHRSETPSPTSIPGPIGLHPPSFSPSLTLSFP